MPQMFELAFRGSRDAREALEGSGFSHTSKGSGRERVSWLWEADYKLVLTPVMSAEPISLTNEELWIRNAKMIRR